MTRIPDIGKAAGRRGTKPWNVLSRKTGKRRTVPSGSRGSTKRSNAQGRRPCLWRTALGARWSRIGQSACQRGRIRGALLVAPSDPEAASFPSGPTGFAPMPLVRLPFPSVVVASSNDPFVTVVRAQTFARAWGSEFVMIRNAGHINTASGLGDWPEGLALLHKLCERRQSDFRETQRNSSPIISSGIGLTGDESAEHRVFERGHMSPLSKTRTHPLTS
jgi:hypothetical protein